MVHLQQGLVTLASCKLQATAARTQTPPTTPQGPLLHVRNVFQRSHCDHRYKHFSPAISPQARSGKSVQKTRWQSSPKFLNQSQHVEPKVNIAPIINPLFKTPIRPRSDHHHPVSLSPPSAALSALQPPPNNARRPRNHPLRATRPAHDLAAGDCQGQAFRLVPASDASAGEAFGVNRFG